MKRALILGIGGQDGSYLADILLEKGYEVHGTYRRSSCNNLARLAHLVDDCGRICLHQADLADSQSIERAIVSCQPHEIYNEADQDSVGWSHVCPAYQFDITAGAVIRTLETIRRVDKSIRFFQPCSAMMFGDAAYLASGVQSPQNEQTPFNPQSPYAVAKVAAYYACRHYRLQHNMFAATAIFYNHDSPRRSDHYLLHKICKGVVRMKRGEQDTLALGNLDAMVDVGYARDYMEAAWSIMQQPIADDYVIGTGKVHSVGELVMMAFELAGMKYDYSRIVKDPEFWHESPRSVLQADCTKARLAFGFNAPTSIRELMLKIMDGE